MDRATAFVLDVVGGVGAAAVVSLSDVELVLNDSVVVLAAVNFDVDSGVPVFGGTLATGVEGQPGRNA